MKTNNGVELYPQSETLSQDIISTISEKLKKGYKAEFKRSVLDVSKDKIKISFEIRKRTKKDEKIDQLHKLMDNLK